VFRTAWKCFKFHKQQSYVAYSFVVTELIRRLLRNFECIPLF
jgi:hypothetical protein